MLGEATKGFFLCLHVFFESTPGFIGPGSDIPVGTFTIGGFKSRYCWILSGFCSRGATGVASGFDGGSHQLLFPGIAPVLGGSDPKSMFTTRHAQTRLARPHMLQIWEQLRLAEFAVKILDKRLDKGLDLANESQHRSIGVI